MRPSGLLRAITQNPEESIYPFTKCISELGDFATLFLSGSATLGRMPLSPFCCQL
jgi:hypothetical protein